jgi:peptide/nickel transport system substrate-binding protein
MKKLSILILVAVLAASLAIEGCTPSATLSTPSSTPATTTQSSPATAGPVRGGVLRTAVLRDPPDFNPYMNSAFFVQFHGAAVFSGLVKADPQKEQVTLQTVIPDLAERWDISSDGKTYTFYLRQGVKFHDGHPFASEDVKYSLDLYRNPKTSIYAAGAEAIDSVDIVNDYTVKVNLKYPYSNLLLSILSPFCEMLPAHLKNVDPKTTDYLVGTGPFKFKSRTVGKVYTYEKNPDYFIKGLPYLDGYEVYILDTSAMVDQFIGGRLDTAGTLRNYLENKERMLRVQQGAPEAIIAKALTGFTRGTQFNLQRKGAWQDVRVRQAMTMVLDYDGLVKAAAGGPEVGHAAPSGLLAFNSEGALQQPEVMAMLGLDKPLDARVAKAKQLMKDAGYADGFSAECIVDDAQANRDAVLLAADLWKRNLNIDMKVTPLEVARLYPRGASGDFDLYFAAVVIPTGTSSVEPLANFTTGAGTNYAKWSNKDYDQLFQQIMREADSSKRIEMIRKAQQIFLNDMPYIIFYAQSQGTAYRPDMRIGWPAVKAPLLQTGNTTLTSIDRLWFSGTPDADRWIKTQK